MVDDSEKRVVPGATPEVAPPLRATVLVVKLETNPLLSGKHCDQPSLDLSAPSVSICLCLSMCRSIFGDISATLEHDICGCVCVGNRMRE